MSSQPSSGARREKILRPQWNGQRSRKQSQRHSRVQSVQRRPAESPCWGRGFTKQLPSSKEDRRRFNLLEVPLPAAPKGEASGKVQKPQPLNQLHTQPTEPGQEEEPGSKGSEAVKGGGHQPFQGSTLTYLGENAVAPSTTRQYWEELRNFHEYAKPRGLKTSDSENLFPSGVPEQDVRGGLPVLQGRSLDSLVLHNHPQYGRMGNQKLPRTWRAIKGFRRLTPGRSRQAFPLPLWAAFAVEMKRLNRLRMSVFLLVALSSYAKPSELLRARVFSLVRPAGGITKTWSLLLCPEEEQTSSKTGEYDVSILLDSPWLAGWAHQFFDCLKGSHASAPFWDFDYQEYQKVFKTVANTFGVDVTPYQTRHSGPSIDRAQDNRSLLEVQKRGQWRAHKSVVRYEKSARLASNWERLPASFKTHALVCEQDLGAFLLGRKEPPRFTPTVV